MDTTGRVGREGASRFSVEILLSHSGETFFKGNPSGFKKVLVSRFFWDTWGGGGKDYHDFLSKKFCFTIPKRFVVNHLDFQKSWGTKNVYGHDGGGREYHDLTSKICCLTVAKSFVEEHFCVAEAFLYLKKIWMRERGITQFCRLFFVSLYQDFS